MENITSEQKQPVMKGFALAGLLAIIIFIAWLAIQIVQVFPTALTSLANLANSVYNYNPLHARTLSLTPGEVLVNAGEPFTVAWEPVSASGTYVFSYECFDASPVTITAGDKQFTDARCGVTYDVGTETSLSVSVTDTKTRYTDISYTVSFFRPNGTTPAATKTATTTIINPAVALEPTTPPETETPPVTVVPAEPVATTSPVTTTENTGTSSPTTSTTPTPTTPATPKPAAPKPVVTTPTYIYELPVSNPNGQSDLAISYLGIGTMNGEVFSNTGVVSLRTTGALQFAVHNIGQKTSEKWSYTALLPNGTTYVSGDEKPLLPNERAVITIQFTAPSDDETRVRYAVDISTKADKNYYNNGFQQNALTVR